MRFIPRCVIRQSSGKQRILDNAHAGGQSAFSSESNKLVLCSALRPAQRTAAALSALGVDRAREVLQSDHLEGGGEGWPMRTAADMVAGTTRNGAAQLSSFILDSCLGFFAVTSFNRYSRFCEAAGRRLLVLLVSLYFDDAHLTEWSSSRGSGQQAFRDLNDISPFAHDKRQDMSLTVNFLGLLGVRLFDCGCVGQKGPG